MKQRRIAFRSDPSPLHRIVIHPLQHQHVIFPGLPDYILCVIQRQWQIDSVINYVGLCRDHDPTEGRSPEVQVDHVLQIPDLRILLRIPFHDLTGFVLRGVVDKDQLIIIKIPLQHLHDLFNRGFYELSFIVSRQNIRYFHSQTSFSFFRITDVVFPASSPNDPMAFAA